MGFLFLISEGICSQIFEPKHETDSLSIIRNTVNMINKRNIKHALCEKCSYSELFWSEFSRIQTEYGQMQSIRRRENEDQNNSEYGHFLRSDALDYSDDCSPGWILYLLFLVINLWGILPSFLVLQDLEKEKSKLQKLVISC